ncbi:conserved hypothetical protein [Verticillium alfalfae VaMs.102]|uniref:Uncharacterized protein n=1 Tax=Verticillium alfalfae (strain VaMs.102 / ATCC MYA-4576 / FGSC 10136) TaxID=526221 RepID=C9S6E2_VERA1|nr:conserved hypothetical protein [Verticillium alfalfae VaMs.102]EEY14454.1 conserved hypothetical protein [Verticillium alfalfae VaMs.102]
MATIDPALAIVMKTDMTHDTTTRDMTTVGTMIDDMMTVIGRGADHPPDPRSRRA